jgi:CRISPR system Cascade subunit CasA
MVEHSLLSEGVFHAVGADGSVLRLSLPQVLARLSAGEDLAFSALRPHQRAPWHAFLVQLAYLALEDQEASQPPTDATAWAEKLRALAPGYDDDGPWCLVNPDWGRPAFLQPPCSAGRVGDFQRSADSAQDIDVLVTARHHDEKTGKLPLNADSLDTLVFALVLLQGWSSFLGKGNYNTMRMNGGFSSRSQFRLVFSRGTGPEFLRDLVALLGARGELADEFARRNPQADGGNLLSLLWLPAWDEGSLPLSAVHPLCLEVCRRVRLVREGGRLLLRRARSNAMRVAAKDMRGDVLDPWVPIVVGDEPKALTAQAHSLGYRSLQALLFDAAKLHKPLLAVPTDRERRANEPGTFIAQVLVSGDGGTDGLWQRELPMPAPVLTQLASAPAALAERSQQFVNLAAIASGKVLRSALLQFVDGSEDVDWKNRDFTRAVEPWLDRFEEAVDEAFFFELFESIKHNATDMQAQGRWVEWLVRAARAHLDAAAQALPSRDGSRLFAHGRAQRFLRRGIRAHFGAYMAASVEPQAESQPDLEDATDG